MDSASGAALFLAAIATSDGLRLLPAGAIVVSRLAAGRWRHVLSADQAERRHRMVTWCSPLDMPVVLRPGDGSSLSLRRRVTRFRARLRRTRGRVATLRIGGVVTLAALVAGVPWLTMRSGVWGLLVGASAVLVLSLVQAIVATLALRRAGRPLGRAALSCARLVWPFSAPRAAEEVMRAVTADVPPLVLLGELLTCDDLGVTIRARLYDAVVRGTADEEVAQLRSWLGGAVLDDLLHRPPATADGHAFCPRCGASFYSGIRFCADCAGIELRARVAH